MSADPRHADACVKAFDRVSKTHDRLKAAEMELRAAQLEYSRAVRALDEAERTWYGRGEKHARSS